MKGFIVALAFLALAILFLFFASPFVYRRDTVGAPWHWAAIVAGAVCALTSALISFGVVNA